MSVSYTHLICVFMGARIYVCIFLVSRPTVNFIDALSYYYFLMFGGLASKAFSSTASTREYYSMS